MTPDTDIETVGATAGKAAAELFNAHARGHKSQIARLLPERVKAANLEAQHLHDSDSEDERAVAIYWASFAEAFENVIKGTH